MLCKKCSEQMRRIETMNSGNGVYHVYQCTTCMNRQTVCMGLGK